MPLSDFALALTIMLVWGGNFAVAKFGLVELPPLMLMALRFWVIALLVVPFARLPLVFLPGVLRLAAVLGCAHFAFMFVGVALIDASTAVLVALTQVPFATLLAVLLFRERPGRRRLAGTAVALTGVAITAVDPDMGGDPLGILCVAIAAVLWALGNLQMKALTAAPVMAVQGWMGLFAAPVLTLMSLTFETAPLAAVAEVGWAGVGAVLYMALLVGIFGYSAWQWLLRRHPVSLMMPLTLLIPVSGVLSAVLALGEPLTIQRVVGGLIAIVGVALLVVEPRRDPP